jgi:Uncharacterized conserved protein (DUF2190)
LSAYTVVKLSAANTVAVYDTTTAKAIGVTQQASQGGAGSSVQVALFGCCKVTAGASVTAGDVVMANSTGAAITRDTTTSIAIGYAIDAGDTNSTIEIFLNPNFK